MVPQAALVKTEGHRKTMAKSFPLPQWSRRFDFNSGEVTWRDDDLSDGDA